MSKTVTQDAVKANTDAVSKSAHESTAAAQELAKAYQELATKHTKTLAASMKALSAVKSPTEFFELQQKLVKQAVDEAMKDSQHIAKLTAAVFTAAFEPIKSRLETVAAKK